LRALQVPPDFQFTLDTPPLQFDTTPPNDAPNPDIPKMPTSGLNWIHRQIGDAEVYFVANPQYRNVEAQCTFRVRGKQPELWWPDTGRTELAAAYEMKDGCTSLPLRFDPSGSLFVVFRRSSRLAPRDAGTTNVLSRSERTTLAGPWEVQFDPKWGGPTKPVTFDKLEDWSRRPEDGIHYYSGTAIYRKVFSLQSSVLSQRTYLDLGRVEVIAEVTLNGKDLGVLWKPPFRVEVTGAVKPEHNHLTVRVTNTWVNRLIGDEHHPDDCGFGDKPYLIAWPDWLLKNQRRPEPGRFTFKTWKHYTKDSPLETSGLLGPVTLVLVK